MTSQSRIQTLYLSQEDLLRAGCLDMGMAMEVAEQAMLAFRNDEILFPEKIVQIFNQDTQERINCLPATLLAAKICGVKWVSVFPANPEKHGVQNLSAIIILSEIERGFPIALLEGTLCSNMRVGAMGGIAAKHFARRDSGDHCVHRGGRAGQNASGGDEEGGTINRGMPGCIEVRARGEAVRG